MTKIVRTVACIDGSQMLYRAEFGFPARIRNRAGYDVTALFGFLALTRKALISSPKRPTHAVVVFDADAPTHRSTLDHRYRATRQPLLNGSPTNPFRHLPWILRALQAWGMACIEHTTSEADDVIASLISQRGAEKDERWIVISRDKDFHQLVSDRVTQWDPTRGGDKGWITPSVIAERYGVHAVQWCDYVSLVGDRSDGMPGIRGVGPVTAARLLGDGRALEDIADQFGRADFMDALNQRALHRLRTDVQLTSTKSSPLPTEGLRPAAQVLEQLELWDASYP
ncbi:MAG TPA: 5'-3' exonuclease H3TH domain-containing protein [Brachybacterium sp.]|nr:5'-3' exonuclease H3TH domain-containing protein [Brachybacterium sp.]